jgi:ADP-heptose:LPS heptosyltransferase
MIVYGAFKGMGDFICATPVIRSELHAGGEVAVLIFPQVTPIIELLDFGVHRPSLRAYHLPVRGTEVSLSAFFRDMSKLCPSSILVSPHAPRVVASWKIPLLLWTLKKRYWPNAKLVGAESEPLSALFDTRIPVNRDLPYMLREWTAYSGFKGDASAKSLPQISFNESLTRLRRLPPDYDLVIHPGAGTQNRKWPPSYLVELVSQLPPQYRIVIVGVPGDIELLRAMFPPGRPIAWIAGPLEQAVASMARSRVALTMDSGSMYFGRVLGVPTVALFGPSDPANVIQPSSMLKPMYEKKWACQPCRRPNCNQSHVFCMASISPKDVAAAVIELVSGT